MTTLVNGPHCQGCIQQPVGQRFIHFDGRGSNGVMIVGDSPWVDEIRLGKPFVGASGALLEATMRRCGQSRENFVITNSMMCKPPFLNWTDKHPDAAIAIKHCAPHLDELIERLQPRVLMPLGAVAMARVIGASGLVNRQSYIHDTAYGIPAVPSFHPSFILQGNQKLAQALFFAMQRALEVSHNPGWRRQATTYLTDPPVAEARHYLFDSWRDGAEAREGEAHPDAEALRWVTMPGRLARHQPGWQPRIPLLVIDIETPNSAALDEEEREDKDPSYTIVRVSCSTSWATAVSVPYQEPYVSLLKEAVEAAAVVVVWNGQGFDLPRLAFNGFTLRGEVHDAMWMWHFLQSDMLKGLGFVAPFFCDLPPWKHLADADPPYYSCCDSDAEFRCYVEIRRHLEQAGRWQRFVRHCIWAGEIFRRPNVGRIVVSPERQARLRQLLEAGQESVLAELQDEVPLSLRNLKLYKTKPKDYEVNPQRYKVTTRQCDCQQQDQQGLPFDANVEVENG